MTKRFAAAVAAFAFASTTAAAEHQDPHQLARDLFKQLVEIKTTESGLGSTPAAEAMAQRLRDAGFPAEDVHVVGPGGRKQNLVARLKGAGRKRPVLLIGAGRDTVEIFSRRGGPLYLQRVIGGRISGITFRYVGSDQHSAINIFDSSCTITQCRATEGILSGVVIYGAECRPSFIDNEVCLNRESGIF